MLAYFNDWNQTLAALDQWARSGLDQRRPAASAGTWPNATLYDTNGVLLLEADVPGLGEKDIQILLEQDVLTISGERKLAVPQGYTVQHQERAPIAFQRAFALPARIDVDAVSASVKDGVLKVVLPKAKESQPRQIAVKAS